MSESLQLEGGVVVVIADNEDIAVLTVEEQAAVVVDESEASVLVDNSDEVTITTDVQLIPGPNIITTSTATDITGILKGDGAFVLAATPGVDYEPALGFTPVPNTRSINTTAPLSGGGNLTADRTLSISLASGSTDGYLSSTDWNTFNNKQASGNYITALTGDVTATGPGSSSATLANSGVSAGTYTNATVTVDAKGRVTAASTGTSGITSVNGDTGPAVTLDTDDISEGATNKYFTDERAQDAVGNILTDSASVDLSYNDGLNSISASVLPAGVDHNSLQNYSANRHIDHTSVSISAGTGLSGGGDISANRTIDLDINDLTTETTPDNADLIAIYDSSASAHRKMTRGNFLSGAVGSDERVKITASDTTAGFLNDKITVTSGKLVKSTVNPGADEDLNLTIGADVFDKTTNTTTDITEGTNLFFTDERAQDAVGGILTDTARIDLSYNDGLNTISADIVSGSVGDSYLAAGINADKIADGSVSNTEFQYINTLTGNAQNQLNDRELLANKATDLTVLNNTLYPTTQAVQSAINSSLTAGAVYMLSGTNSDISGYESAVSLSLYTAGSLATVSAVASTTPTLLEEFATNSGFPNSVAIPVGLITAHWETQKAAGSNNYYTYFELYKRASGGTETLLLTSDNSSQSALNTVIQVNVTAFNTSTITLLTTDRLVMKVYAVMVSSTANITLRWDDNTDSRFQLPGSSLSYVPEDTANKTTDFTGNTGSNIKFATVKATFDAIVGYLANYEPLLGFDPVNKAGDGMTGNLQLPNIIVADGVDGFMQLASQSGSPPTTLIDNGIQIYSIDSEHFSIRGTNGMSNYTMSLRISELTTDRILRFKDEDGYIMNSNLGSGRVWIGDASDVATATSFSGHITLENDGNTIINDDVITNSMVNDNAQIAGTKLRPSVTALADAATISVNATSGNQFTVTLGGNRTLGNPTGAYNGQILLFAIRQDATGNRTLAADTKYRFNDVFSDFELNATAAKTTYIICRYHSTDDKFDVLDIRRMD